MKCSECDSKGRWYVMWGFWNKGSINFEAIVPEPRICFCDDHKPQPQPLQVKDPERIQSYLNAKYPGMGLLVGTGYVQFSDVD